MEKQINERVEVQAHVARGKSTPLSLNWKGRTYQIIDVQRDEKGGKARHRELFTAAIVDLRRIKLMHDHKKKEWILISID